MKRPEGFDAGAKKPAAPVTPLAAPKKSPSARAQPTEPRLREAKANLRAAQRERKNYEKSEVKRFTRRARSRRRVIIASILLVVVLVGGVAVAVFSPLLALTTIDIRGTSRVDPAAVHEVLDDQLGTPLALVNLDHVTHELAAFPLIRSYTTEVVPPHTLVVTIVERTPVGVVADGSSFAVVDAAGIVLDSVAARPAGLPRIDAGEPSMGNPAFTSAIEVLLALPAELLGRVDSITATTEDDVTFVLAGDVQAVTWGSADRSDFKARVLNSLVATQDPNARVEYDVSAPDAPVLRAR